MLPPLLSITGVLFALCVSFMLYHLKVLSPSAYFFTPIFVLIGYHTVIMQFLSRSSFDKVALSRVIKKSIGKYLFWLILISSLYGIYTNHPFYIRFAPNTALMLAFYIKVYLVLGLPYFIYVERYRTGRFEWLNDPYLKVLSLLKVTYKRDWSRLRHRLFKYSGKSLILSWLIRLHFLPVMVEQVYWGTGQTVNFLSNPSAALTNVMFFIALLFLIDSINASIGYFWESAVTKTRFRAADPNAFHWIVVLMCYMPFIGFASTFVPFPEGNLNSPLLFAHPLFEFGVNLLTIAALLGIVLATSCLGFSYSNLSYKKIQTRGPYAIVRHPGTVFKITFFFLTIFRFEASYTLPIIAAYVFWMGVYIVRIICEERFLIQFKEYQDYTKVTRYRLIPKVW